MFHNILQEQIVKYCDKNNIYCKCNHNDNQQAKWGNLEKLGVRNGASDLEVIINGNLTFVELKVGRDKQRKSQIKFQKYVESFNLKYVIISSLEEFINML